MNNSDHLNEIPDLSIESDLTGQTNGGRQSHGQDTKQNDKKRRQQQVWAVNPFFHHNNNK